MAKPVKPVGRKPNVNRKPAAPAPAKVAAPAAVTRAEPVASVADVSADPVVDAVETVAATAEPVTEAAQAQIEIVAETVETQAEVVVETVEATTETAADTAAAVIEQAADAVESATQTVASTQAKDVTFMATAFETPKMVTEMNERAKGAMEKGGKVVAEFGEFAKGNVEALVESTRITAKGFESLGQDAADYTRKSFEGMTANLRSLASVKSPTEFFKLQNDYVRSAFDDAVAQTSKSTEALMKLAGDAAQPLSSRFAVAAEKVKTVA